MLGGRWGEDLCEERRLGCWGEERGEEKTWREEWRGLGAGKWEEGADGIGPETWIR